MNARSNDQLPMHERSSRYSTFDRLAHVRVRQNLRTLRGDLDQIPHQLTRGNI